MSATRHGPMGAAPDRISVLHIDDEPEVADVAATFLERADDRFDVETATSAETGLARLREDEIDCVVSDYEMPGRTGIEFLRAVRDEYPNLPFILYTGKGSEEIASDAISAGATDYLQKEVGTGQYELLANRIANAVAKAHGQRGERHLRELAENTDRILYIFTGDWSELLFINSAYEDIWNRSVAALRADPTDFLDGIHPADRERVHAAMERMSGGNTIEIEYRVNAATDYGTWVRVRGEPIVDETGTVVRVAGFAADITEHKELQRTLQRRTERLEEAQRVAGVGSWEWDPATDTVVWSDETYRIFGREPGDPTEPSFDDWFAAIHPEDRELVGEMVEEAMETGTYPTFEHRLETPDGEVGWVRCNGRVRTDDGEVTGITGTVLDITDAVESERTLEYQRSVLESVVETLPQAILVVDDGGTVFTANDAFERLWDVTVAAGDRAPVGAIGAELADPDGFAEMVEFYRDHPAESGHEPLARADGSTVACFSAPATGADGTTYGRIWVFEPRADHSV